MCRCIYVYEYEYEYVYVYKYEYVYVYKHVYVYQEVLAESGDREQLDPAAGGGRRRRGACDYTGHTCEVQASGGLRFRHRRGRLQRWQDGASFQLRRKAAVAWQDGDPDDADDVRSVHGAAGPKFVPWAHTKQDQRHDRQGQDAAAEDPLREQPPARRARRSGGERARSTTRSSI